MIKIVAALELMLECNHPDAILVLLLYVWSLLTNVSEAAGEGYSKAAGFLEILGDLPIPGRSAGGGRVEYGDAEPL